MDDNLLLLLAKQYFSVSFPLKKSEFKTAFNNACKKYHPDTGGTAEQFNIMKSLYDEIEFRYPSRLFYSDSENDIMNKIENIKCWSCDGIGELQEIFKGQILNRSKCNICKGSGYISRDSMRSAIKDVSSKAQLRPRPSENKK